MRTHLSPKLMAAALAALLVLPVAASAQRVRVPARPAVSRPVTVYRAGTYYHPGYGHYYHDGRAHVAYPYYAGYRPLVRSVYVYPTYNYPSYFAYPSYYPYMAPYPYPYQPAAPVVPPYTGGYEPQYTAEPASIEVRLPSPDALLWFDTTKSSQGGTMRYFTTPPMSPGATSSYEVKAQWITAGGPVEEMRIVTVRPGQHVTVDFTVPAGERLPAGKSK